MNGISQITPNELKKAEHYMKNETDPKRKQYLTILINAFDPKKRLFQNPFVAQLREDSYAPLRTKYLDFLKKQDVELDIDEIDFINAIGDEAELPCNETQCTSCSSKKCQDDTD